MFVRLVKRQVTDWPVFASRCGFMHWRRKWQPTPVFLPGESRDGGAWWAAVYGVAQSQTRLRRLSNSSSSSNPKLPVLPFPVPPPPWQQQQVYSLCLGVCFRFVDIFICVQYPN